MTEIGSLSALLDRVRHFLNQTSVDLYDLLPPEDREAIAWVRSNGGLERIKVQRRESIPRAAYERKKAGFLGHIAECERALGRRRDAIARLANENDALRLERAQMRPRLMPEGMEWPRFEDGEPVRIGDDFERDGDENGVSTVTVYLDGSFALNFRAYSRGERVKRPAPKVLDADGVEVEVGDDLYTVEGMLKFHVSAIDKKSGRIATEAMSALDKWADPKMYTHRAPVLAADGRPLREGETVWGVDGGGPYVVEEPLNKNGLTVLEADGVSRAFSRFPDHLTHERPDSWEQLEDDATVSPEVYCVRRGIDISDVDSAHIVLDDVTERMARDLVCRARALAERGE